MNPHGNSHYSIEIYNRFQILDELPTPLDIENHHLPDEDSYHVEEAQAELEQVRNDFLNYRESIANQIKIIKENLVRMSGTEKTVTEKKPEEYQELTAAEAQRVMLNGIKQLQDSLDTQGSDLGTKIDRVSDRVSKLELKGKKPEDGTKGETEKNSAITTDEGDPIASSTPERVQEQEDQGSAWNKVVRSKRNFIQTKAPTLTSSGEDPHTHVAGFVPREEDIRRYDRIKTDAIDNMETPNNSTNDFRQRNYRDTPREAGLNYLPRRKVEEIRRLRDRLMRMENPGRGDENRTGNVIPDYRWNIYLEAKAYQAIESKINKAYNNVADPHERMIAKRCNTYRYEVILGPFLQENWRRAQGDMGLRDRPRYIPAMVYDHIRDKLGFTEREADKLDLISAKPLQEDLTKLYPPQIRCTFASPEMANYIMMKHSMVYGNMPAKMNKCRPMMDDEMCKRYYDLKKAADLSKQTFNARNSGNRMFTFIAFGGDPRIGNINDFVVYKKTTNTRSGWHPMDTSYIQSALWTDDFPEIPGRRLDGYQKRIMDKKRKALTVPENCEDDDWEIPVVSNEPMSKRGNSRLDESMSYYDEEDLEDDDPANTNKQARFMSPPGKEILRYNSSDNSSFTFQPSNSLEEAIIERVLNDDIQQNTSSNSTESFNQNTDKYVANSSTDFNIIDVVETSNMVTIHDDQIPSDSEINTCAPIQTPQSQSHYTIKETAKGSKDDTAATEVIAAAPEAGPEPIAVSKVLRLNEIRSSSDSNPELDSKEMTDQKSECQVEMKSTTKSVTISLTTPEVIMNGFNDVLFSFPQTRDRFMFGDSCYVIFDEVKKSARFVKCSVINKAGKIHEDISMEVRQKKLIMTSRTGWTIDLPTGQQVSLIVGLWELIISNLLTSVTERVAKREDGQKAGKCTHRKCKRKALARKRCAVCKKFIHEVASCSSRGACKSECLWRFSVKHSEREEEIKKSLRKKWETILTKVSKEEKRKRALEEIITMASKPKKPRLEEADTPGVPIFKVKSLKTIVKEKTKQLELQAEYRGEPTTSDNLRAIMSEGRDIETHVRDLILKIADAVVDRKTSVPHQQEPEPVTEINLSRDMGLTQTDLDNLGEQTPDGVHLTKNYPTWKVWNKRSIRRKLEYMYFLREREVDKSDSLWEALTALMVEEGDLDKTSYPESMRRVVMDTTVKLKLMDRWVNERCRGDKQMKQHLKVIHSRAGRDMGPDRDYILQGIAETMKRELRIMHDMHAEAPGMTYEVFRPREAEKTKTTPIWMAYSTEDNEFRAMRKREDFERDKKKKSKGKGKTGKRLTPEQQDEKRRRTEVRKTDERVKLDALEAQVNNYKRSLGQAEQKIKLLTERNEKLEKYNCFLEGRILKLENVPVDATRDLIFSATDHYTIMKLREESKEMKEKLESMSKSMSTLTNTLSQGNGVDDINLDNPNSDTSHISAQTLQGGTAGILKDITQTRARRADRDPPPSPSTLSVREKVSKFSKLANTQGSS